MVRARASLRRAGGGASGRPEPRRVRQRALPVQRVGVRTGPGRPGLSQDMTVDDARAFVEQLARQLQESEERTRPIPDPSPRLAHSRLCVAMATFDDFDGACFTIQSVRLGHPDLLDEISFLVVDNHPEGAAAPALRSLADTVPNLRY